MLENVDAAISQPIGQATAAAKGIWGDATVIARGVQATGVGGGFEFPSVEEIDAILGMWRQRQTSMMSRRNTLDQMTAAAMQSPADDDATTGYMSTWTKSFGQLRAQHDSMIDFINSYIDRLEAAKTAKQTGEQDTQHAIKQTAGDTAQ